jgi:iron-sulfur cluster assembly protein
MAVSLTERAAGKVRELMAESPGSEWLRLGIRGGGCSGMSYFMDLVPSPGESDRTWELSGIKVCIDRKSYLFLNGIELDYDADLVRSGFRWENPQARRTCSCGTSFAV